MDYYFFVPPSPNIRVPISGSDGRQRALGLGPGAAGFRSSLSACLPACLLLLLRL